MSPGRPALEKTSGGSHAGTVPRCRQAKWRDTGGSGEGTPGPGGPPGRPSPGYCPSSGAPGVSISGEGVAVMSSCFWSIPEPPGRFPHMEMRYRDPGGRGRLWWGMGWRFCPARPLVGSLAPGHGHLITAVPWTRAAARVFVICRICVPSVRLLIEYFSETNAIYFERKSS